MDVQIHTCIDLWECRCLWVRLPAHMDLQVCVDSHTCVDFVCVCRFSHTGLWIPLCLALCERVKSSWSHSGFFGPWKRLKFWKIKFMMNQVRKPKLWGFSWKKIHLGSIIMLWFDTAETFPFHFNPFIWCYRKPMSSPEVPSKCKSKLCISKMSKWGILTFWNSCPISFPEFCQNQYHFTKTTGFMEMVFSSGKGFWWNVAAGSLICVGPEAQQLAVQLHARGSCAVLPHAMSIVMVWSAAAAFAPLQRQCWGLLPWSQLPPLPVILLCLALSAWVRTCVRVQTHVQLC